MKDYRIVELRPDVFAVEEFKTGGWWIWRYEEWHPVQGYIAPSVPEYSPMATCEFTLSEAEVYIARRREKDEVNRLRANPPSGYPRVVS